MKILIVEDEKHIYTPLKTGLESYNYAVDVSEDGLDGYERISNNSYDIVILDLNVPGIDGVALCKKIRAEGIKTPVLMLTARSQIEDKILGLETGADDYMTKPFSFKELLLRVNNLIKRNSINMESIYKIGDLSVDLTKRTVFKGEHEVALNKKEFGILEYLVVNIGEIVSQEEIIDHVWSSDEVDMFSNTIRTQILNLRKKVDPRREIIETIKGQGYRIKNNK